jgi:hypothetical protein
MSHCKCDECRSQSERKYERGKRCTEYETRHFTTCEDLTCKGKVRRGDAHLFATDENKKKGLSIRDMHIQALDTRTQKKKKRRLAVIRAQNKRGLE